MNGLYIGDEVKVFGLPIPGRIIHINPVTEIAHIQFDCAKVRAPLYSLERTIEHG